MAPPRAVLRVRREDQRGSTVTIHGREITPIARLMTIAWPGGRMVRETPVAIEVNEQGWVRRIPIRDATPRAILAMALAEVALGAVIWWALGYWKANRATANRATANRATANRATANRATANRATEGERRRAAGIR
jgi:hypothetical protein